MPVESVKDHQKNWHPGDSTNGYLIILYARGAQYPRHPSCFFHLKRFVENSERAEGDVIWSNYKDQKLQKVAFWKGNGTLAISGKSWCREVCFQGFCPLFFFHWQELFFASLDNWAYWQKGSNPQKAWTGAGDTKKKSKGQKRVQRGIDRGYSSTARRATGKMLPPPRGDASATVGNPAFSKAASVPASVPDAAADASVPGEGAILFHLARCRGIQKWWFLLRTPSAWCCSFWSKTFDAQRFLD